MRRTQKGHNYKLLLIPLAAAAISMTTLAATPIRIQEEIITETPVIVQEEHHILQAQVTTPEPKVVYKDLTMFTTETVYLRQYMTKNSQPLAILTQDEVVQAQETEDSEWYAVSYGGVQGYVIGECLKEYDSDTYLDIGLDYVHQDVVREMIELFQMDVDEYFFYGMMYTENRFQNKPESAAGAQGILQIIPSTWKFLYKDFRTEFPEQADRVVNDATDKTSNIILGMYYIHELQRDYGFDSIKGNEHTLLTAYNRGQGGANAYYKQYGTYSTPYSREILRAAEYIRTNKTWKEGL